jgi:hypothetical protein
VGQKTPAKVYLKSTFFALGLSCQKKLVGSGLEQWAFDFDDF